MVTTTSIVWSPGERNEASRRFCSFVRERSQRVLGAMGIREDVSVASPIGFAEADLKASIAQKKARLREVDPHHPLLYGDHRSAGDKCRHDRSRID